MAELIEKDPQVAQIVDKNSQRNLLDVTNPNPLSIDCSAGQAVRHALQVVNGPEGLIDLAISADEPWLEVENSKLTLIGGETGDCIIKVKPDGQGEYANLLFSWEGSEQTICQSVMVQRKLGAAATPEVPQPAGGGGGTASPEPAQQTDRTDVTRKLKSFIEGCGGPDKFIDIDEEYKIFRYGGELEFSLSETESILNNMCSEAGWTRQKRLTDKLTAMLHEATKDDGVIDKQEFEHIVNFAIKRRMPRQDAVCHCAILILDNNWRTKEGMFDKWWKKIRKDYGL